MAAPFSGVAYVSRVENQVKRSSNLFLLFSEIFGHVRSCMCALVFLYGKRCSWDFDHRNQVLTLTLVLAGSKGRCPLCSRTLSCYIIEQCSYINKFGLEKRLPEVRVGAHLDLECRVVNVIEQRNYLDNSVFEKIPEVRVGARLDLERSNRQRYLSNVTIREFGF